MRRVLAYTFMVGIAVAVAATYPWVAALILALAVLLVIFTYLRKD